MPYVLNSRDKSYPLPESMRGIVLSVLKLEFISIRSALTKAEFNLVIARLVSALPKDEAKKVAKTFVRQNNTLL